MLLAVLTLSSAVSEGETGARAMYAAPDQRTSNADTTRRVNAPYFAGAFDWAQTAIFWFGRNDHGVPSRNYADVRVGYTPDGLRVRVTVVDYYLWYREGATPSDDLTRYDAVAVYLDSGHTRAVLPTPDDYYFLLGARHWPNEDAPQYRRQARGSGSEWDTAWNGSWLDYSAMSWSCDPGPNSNYCGIDFGWTGIFAIPWETLGRTGPPSQGTVWGMGVLLYDRDDAPPDGYVAPDHWPDTFVVDNPSSWGKLHFGYADYRPRAAAAEESVLIRAASPTDDTVQDAWMGGGGTCGGGHEGGSEINHGDDTSLFVGTETAPTHFPCFSKSYLRFALSDIPPGKVILSATLTVHLWGNAGDPGQAQHSWVHLFSVHDPWDEMTIHWNNAPLAHENVAVTRVDPVATSADSSDIPYGWDATQAAAEAHTRGEALNVALYSSDTAQHSTKYLTSSNAGDWNAEGRPTLTVVYGEPAGTVDKYVHPVASSSGQMITYTMVLLGSGHPLSLTDTLPDGVSDPGSIQATDGIAAYQFASRRVEWSGTPAIGQPVTVTFPVTVRVSGPVALINTATLTDTITGTDTDTAVAIANGVPFYLPLALKQ